MVSQYKSGLGFMRLVRQVPPNSKFCRFTTVVKRSSRPTYIDLPWLTKLVSEISWNHVPKSWKSCPICGSIHPHQDYSKYVFGYPPWLYSILSYFSPYMKKQLQSRIRAKPTILWSKKTNKPSPMTLFKNGWLFNQKWHGLWHCFNHITAKFLMFFPCQCIHCDITGKWWLGPHILFLSQHAWTFNYVSSMNPMVVMKQPIWIQNQLRHHMIVPFLLP